MHASLADCGEAGLVPRILDVADATTLLYAVRSNDDGFAFPLIGTAAVVRMIEVLPGKESVPHELDPHILAHGDDGHCRLGGIGVVDGVENGESSGKFVVKGSRFRFRPVALAVVAVAVADLDVDLALTPFGVALALGKEWKAAAAGRQEAGKEKLEEFAASGL